MEMDDKLAKHAAPDAAPAAPEFGTTTTTAPTAVPQTFDKPEHDTVETPSHKSSDPDDSDPNVPKEPLHAVQSARSTQSTRSKTRIVLIMSALCMAVFLGALDMTIVTTALPTISRHFNSAAAFTWVGTAYLLAAAAAQPLWGKVSDIWGRKPILLLCNLIFFIGSLLVAIAVNVTMLIVGRAIQGVGGGGLIILVNIVIGDLFSIADRSIYYGVIGMVWALAGALGPLVGGALTDHVSWRYCFYINLPITGVAFFIILFTLDIQTPKTPLWEGLKAIDWLGALTIVGGTVMLLLGLEFGGVTHPWASVTVICMIVFGAVTLGIFLLIEWKFAKYPVMPLRLFKDRSAMAAFGVVFMHGAVFMAGSYFLPLYFQAVLGATPTLSGVYLLAYAFSMSIVSALIGVVIRKTNHYNTWIWMGMLTLTLGFGLFIDLPTNPGWAKIILYQIVAAIGVGPNFQSPLIALQNVVDPRDIATATGTLGFIRNLATAISVVIGSVVFQNQMNGQAATLRAALGPEMAARLSGGRAGANIDLIASLPPNQRTIARMAFNHSLSRMWIMYTCLAAIGFLCSLLIVSKKLTHHHTETKTGLAVEKEKRQAAEEAKRLKKEKAQTLKDLERK